MSRNTSPSTHEPAPFNYRSIAGSVMWLLISLFVVGIAAAAVFRLDPTVLAIAAGALVVACLATCVGVAVLDGRQAKHTEHLVDQILRRTGRN